MKGAAQGRASKRGARLFAALVALAAAARAPAQCPTAKLTAADGAAADLFGSALDARGERLLAGAWLADDACPRDPDCNSGKAYVFERGGGGWVQAAELVPAEQAAKQKAGRSVALGPEFAVLGALDDGFGSTDPGSLHVFEREGGAWVERARLFAPGGGTGQGFGTSVAAGEATIAGGAPGAPGGGHAGAGIVHVFERARRGWRHAQELLAFVPDDGMEFGAALAIDGERLLAGAPGDMHAGDDSGSAWPFVRAGGRWISDGRLVAAEAHEHDRFGAVLALDGTLAAVAARGHDQPLPDAGAVWIFERAPEGWIQRAKLSSPDARAGQRFGWSLALEGDTLAVGVPFDDGAGGEALGAVYLFRERAGAWTFQAKLRTREADPGDFLGGAVALAEGRLFAGASSDDDLGSSAGAVHVFDLAPFARSACFCAAAAPCGNLDPVAGCATSTGAGVRLSACGSPSVLADTLVLAFEGLPAGALAIPMMGSAGAPAPFADGLLCLSARAPRFRFPALAAVGGRAQLGPGIAAASRALFPPAGAIAAGQTRWFQAWISDAGGSPCGQGANASHALAVRFAP